MSTSQPVVAYGRPPRRALADLPADAEDPGARNTFWGGDELRVLGCWSGTETALRATGTEVTIRTLWVHLADRCGRGG